MRADIRKLLILALAGLMITGSCNKSWAFPLPTLDIKRIAEEVKKNINMVKEIKNEIDSNMHIIREIQHGGFGAAAGQLFAKIQNGDYDRFGANIKGLGQNLKSAAKKDSDAAAKKAKNKEKAQQEADAAAAEKRDKNIQAEAAAQELTEQNLKKRKENAFQKAYNWLKNNKGATDAATNTIRAAEQGDWTGMAGAVGQGIGAVGGSGTDDKNVWDHISDGVQSGSNATQSALDGNWGDVVNSVGQGVGNQFGNENTSGLINDITNVASGVTGAATNGNNDNFLDFAQDVAKNGSVTGSAENLGKYLQGAFGNKKNNDNENGENNENNENNETGNTETPAPVQPQAQ